MPSGEDDEALWLSRLFGAVADHLEHETVGIEEVGGVVLPVLGNSRGAWTTSAL
jgi:hypothetical protein